MPRAARGFSGWIRIIDVPPLTRHVFQTNLSAQEEALGWLDYVAEVKDVGVKFLRDRGHTTSPQNSFRLFQAFIRQAKTFYRSAENLDYRSSPLNHYYSFLNLAKAYILVNQPQFTGRRSGHGLGFNLGRGRLSKQFVTAGKRGVFHSFYREIMGKQLQHGVQLNVATLLGYCSDIGVEYQIGGFGRHRGSPAKIAIVSDRRANDCWLLVAIRDFDILEPYQKSLRVFNILMEEVDLPNPRARELFEIMGEFKRGFRFFQSRARYPHRDGNIIPARKIIADWSNATKVFLTVHPYRDGFDFVLNPPLRVTLQVPIKEPLALYAVIYFLGSLVRYHPEFLESLLASRDAWIIERFTKSAPGSLLLYMRNLIDGVNFAYISR